DPAGPEPNPADPEGTIDDHYTAAITWGDGPITLGTITLGNDNVFTVTGTHTYAEEGNYTIGVTVHHESAVPHAVVTSSAVVADAPLTAYVSGNATEGTPFSGQVATFTDAAGSYGFLSDFTATITWDDLSTSMGTITGTAGTYTVSGSHSYDEEGSYPVT